MTLEYDMKQTYVDENLYYFFPCDDYSLLLNKGCMFLYVDGM